MKKQRKIWLLLLMIFSIVMITSCNLVPGVDPNKPDPVKPEDFGKPEAFKTLESGKKYEIVDGKKIVVPKDSKVLKVLEEGGKKYLLTLTAGKEVGIETTKEGVKTVYEYTVDYRIVAFSRGQDLTSYESGSLFDHYLRKDVAPYMVGFGSPYLMDLVTSAAIFDSNYQTKLINLSTDLFDINYQLFENDLVVEINDYASVSKAGIQFLASANGKTFTIIASIVSETLNLPAVEQIVLVGPGVNVHNNEELKIAFANLDIHQIHIHRDIKAELNSDQLYEFEGKFYPYNINDIETEEELGLHGNAYRRYHVDSIGELTINGNYFTIDGSNIPLMIGEGAYQAGYVDSAKTIISSQSSIFRFGTSVPEYNSDNWVKFTNLSVFANANRPDPDDLSISGGHAALRNDNTNLVMDNVNVEYAVCGVFSVYNRAKTFMYYSKISNSWASNILMWGSAYALVEDSYLSNSGGASISVVDDKSGENQSGLEGYLDPELVINNTTISNLTSGTSPWFRAYQLTEISNMVSGIDNSLQGINQASGGLLDVTLFGEKESSQEDSQFNFAILIQNSNPIDPNSGPYPQAKVTIDGVSVYRPYNYKVINDLIKAVVSQGAIFTPFGYDVAQTMFNLFMSNSEYQQILATGTSGEIAALINTLFASAVIDGFMQPTGVNKEYFEMMPGAFNVTAIVEVFRNK